MTYKTINQLITEITPNNNFRILVTGGALHVRTLRDKLVKSLSKENGNYKVIEDGIELNSNTLLFYPKGDDEWRIRSSKWDEVIELTHLNTDNLYN